MFYSNSETLNMNAHDRRHPNDHDGGCGSEILAVIAPKNTESVDKKDAP